MRFGSLALVCLGLLASAAACKPSVRQPLDPSAVPAGHGWSCYQHAEPGTVSLGICFREEAKCAQEGAADGGAACKPQAEAFCMDAHPGGGDHDVRCVATMADCEELARNLAGLGPTQCASVP